MMATVFWNSWTLQRCHVHVVNDGRSLFTCQFLALTPTTTRSKGLKPWQKTSQNLTGTTTTYRNISRFFSKRRNNTSSKENDKKAYGPKSFISNCCRRTSSFQWVNTHWGAEKSFFLAPWCARKSSDRQWPTFLNTSGMLRNPGDLPTQPPLC